MCFRFKGKLFSLMYVFMTSTRVWLIPRWLTIFFYYLSHVLIFPLFNVAFIFFIIAMVSIGFLLFLFVIWIYLLRRLRFLSNLFHCSIKLLMQFVIRLELHMQILIHRHQIAPRDESFYILIDYVVPEFLFLLSGVKLHWICVDLLSVFMVAIIKSILLDELSCSFPLLHQTIQECLITLCQLLHERFSGLSWKHLNFLIIFITVRIHMKR